jgi:hypothetical protein
LVSLAKFIWSVVPAVVFASPSVFGSAWPYWPPGAVLQPIGEDAGEKGQTGLQDFLVCVEMLIAACAHKSTSGAETYANGSMRTIMEPRALYLAEISYKRGVEAQAAAAAAALAAVDAADTAISVDANVPVDGGASSPVATDDEAEAEVDISVDEDALQEGSESDEAVSELDAAHTAARTAACKELIRRSIGEDNSEREGEGMCEEDLADGSRGHLPAPIPGQRGGGAAGG